MLRPMVYCYYVKVILPVIYVLVTDFVFTVQIRWMLASDLLLCHQDLFLLCLISYTIKECVYSGWPHFIQEMEIHVTPDS